MILKNWKKIN